MRENAGAHGSQLLEGLKALQQKHGKIGDVCVKELMCALELASDRGTEKPISKEMPFTLQ